MKKYRPYTKSRRHMTTVSYGNVITATEPHKALTKGGKRHVGRSAGRISMRHKGGGHKRLLRDVDFTYKKHVPAVVETVEYDPNRTGFIGLLKYADGAIVSTSLKSGESHSQDLERNIKPFDARVDPKLVEDFIKQAKN
jgi:large subunit ribosomal protein L2